VRPDYKRLYWGFAVRIAARLCKVKNNLTPPVPTNINKALSGFDKEKWMVAFQDELNSLEKIIT
jgi:predicted SPOUT superfamily RNA methylase MTH1